MKYTAPPSVGSGAIALGHPFKAETTREAFVRLREVLGGTVGDYRGSSGNNIRNNRVSLGARDFQPGALTEVFRSDPFTTGPQNYLLPDLLASTSPPFGDVMTFRSEPAGACVSFTPRATGRAYIFLNSGVEWADSRHIVATAGGTYKFHDLRVHASIIKTTGTIESLLVQDSEIEWRVKDTAEGKGQVNSTSLFYIDGVVPNYTYSYRLRLNMHCTVEMTADKHTGAAGISGSNTFAQFIGSGSSATAVVVYK